MRGGHAAAASAVAAAAASAGGAARKDASTAGLPPVSDSLLATLSSHGTPLSVLAATAPAATTGAGTTGSAASTGTEPASGTPASSNVGLGSGAPAVASAPSAFASAALPAPPPALAALLPALLDGAPQPHEVATLLQLRVLRARTLRLRLLHLLNFFRSVERRLTLDDYGFPREDPGQFAPGYTLRAPGRVAATPFDAATQRTPAAPSAAADGARARRPGLPPLVPAFQSAVAIDATERGPPTAGARVDVVSSGAGAARSALCAAWGASGAGGATVASATPSSAAFTTASGSESDEIAARVVAALAAASGEGASEGTGGVGSVSGSAVSAAAVTPDSCERDAHAFMAFGGVEAQHDSYTWLPGTEGEGEAEEDAHPAAVSLSQGAVPGATADVDAFSHACLGVIDANGAAIMYTAALADLALLETQLIRLGSYQTRAHLAAVNADLLDRWAIIVDLFEAEYAFTRAKASLVHMWLAVYEHAIVPGAQRAVAAKIIAVMSARPEIDADPAALLSRYAVSPAPPAAASETTATASPPRTTRSARSAPAVAAALSASPLWSQSALQLLLAQSPLFAVSHALPHAPLRLAPLRMLTEQGNFAPLSAPPSHPLVAITAAAVASTAAPSATASVAAVNAPGGPAFSGSTARPFRYFTHHYAAHTEALRSRGALLQHWYAAQLLRERSQAREMAVPEDDWRVFAHTIPEDALDLEPCSPSSAASSDGDDAGSDNESGAASGAGSVSGTLRRPRASTASSTRPGTSPVDLPAPNSGSLVARPSSSSLVRDDGAINANHAPPARAVHRRGGSISLAATASRLQVLPEREEDTLPQGDPGSSPTDGLIGRVRLTIPFSPERGTPGGDGDDGDDDGDEPQRRVNKGLKDRIARSRRRARNSRVLPAVPQLPQPADDTRARDPLLDCLKTLPMPAALTPMQHRSDDGAQLHGDAGFSAELNLDTSVPTVTLSSSLRVSDAQNATVLTHVQSGVPLRGYTSLYGDCVPAWRRVRTGLLEVFPSLTVLLSLDAAADAVIDESLRNAVPAFARRQSLMMASVQTSNAPVASSSGARPNAAATPHAPTGPAVLSANTSGPVRSTLAYGSEPAWDALCVARAALLQLRLQAEHHASEDMVVRLQGLALDSHALPPLREPLGLPDNDGRGGDSKVATNNTKSVALKGSKHTPDPVSFIITCPGAPPAPAAPSAASANSSAVNSAIESASSSTVAVPYYTGGSGDAALRSLADGQRASLLLACLASPLSMHTAAARVRLPTFGELSFTALSDLAQREALLRRHPSLAAPMPSEQGARAGVTAARAVSVAHSLLSGSHIRFLLSMAVSPTLTQPSAAADALLAPKHRLPHSVPHAHARDRRSLPSRARLLMGASQRSGLGPSWAWAADALYDSTPAASVASALYRRETLADRALTAASVLSAVQLRDDLLLAVFDNWVLEDAYRTQAARAGLPTDVPTVLPSWFVDPLWLARAESAEGAIAPRATSTMTTPTPVTVTTDGDANDATAAAAISSTTSSGIVPSARLAFSPGSHLSLPAPQRLRSPISPARVLRNNASNGLYMPRFRAGVLRHLTPFICSPRARAHLSMPANATDALALTAALRAMLLGERAGEILLAGGGLRSGVVTVAPGQGNAAHARSHWPWVTALSAARAHAPLSVTDSAGAMSESHLFPAPRVLILPDSAAVAALCPSPSAPWERPAVSRLPYLLAVAEMQELLPCSLWQLAQVDSVLRLDTARRDLTRVALRTRRRAHSSSSASNAASGPASGLVSSGSDSDSDISNSLPSFDGRNNGVNCDNKEGDASGDEDVLQYDLARPLVRTGALLDATVFLSDAPMHPASTMASSLGWVSKKRCLGTSSTARAFLPAPDSARGGLLAIRLLTCAAAATAATMPQSLPFKLAANYPAAFATAMGSDAFDELENDITTPQVGVTPTHNNPDTAAKKQLLSNFRTPRAAPTSATNASGQGVSLFSIGADTRDMAFFSRQRLDGITTPTAARPRGTAFTFGLATGDEAPRPGGSGLSLPEESPLLRFDTADAMALAHPSPAHSIGSLQMQLVGGDGVVRRAAMTPLNVDVSEGTSFGDSVSGALGGLNTPHSTRAHGSHVRPVGVFGSNTSSGIWQSSPHTVNSSTASLGVALGSGSSSTPVPLLSSTQGLASDSASPEVLAVESAYARQQLDAARLRQEARADAREALQLWFSAAHTVLAAQVAQNASLNIAVRLHEALINAPPVGQTYGTVAPVSNGYGHGIGYPTPLSTLTTAAEGGATSASASTMSTAATLSAQLTSPAAVASLATSAMLSSSAAADAKGMGPITASASVSSSMGGATAGADVFVSASETYARSLGLMHPPALRVAVGDGSGVDPMALLAAAVERVIDAQLNGTAAATTVMEMHTLCWVRLLRSLPPALLARVHVPVGPKGVTSLATTNKSSFDAYNAAAHAGSTPVPAQWLARLLPAPALSGIHSVPPYAALPAEARPPLVPSGGATAAATATSVESFAPISGSSMLARPSTVSTSSTAPANAAPADRPPRTAADAVTLAASATASNGALQPPYQPLSQLERRASTMAAFYNELYSTLLRRRLWHHSCYAPLAQPRSERHAAVLAAVTAARTAACDIAWPGSASAALAAHWAALSPQISAAELMGNSITRAPAAATARGSTRAPVAPVIPLVPATSILSALSAFAAPRASEPPDSGRIALWPALCTAAAMLAARTVRSADSAATLVALAHATDTALPLPSAASLIASTASANAPTARTSNGLSTTVAAAALAWPVNGLDGVSSVAAGLYPPTAITVTTVTSTAVLGRPGAPRADYSSTVLTNFTLGASGSALGTLAAPGATDSLPGATAGGTIVYTPPPPSLLPPGAAAATAGASTGEAAAAAAAGGINTVPWCVAAPMLPGDPGFLPCSTRAQPIGTAERLAILAASAPRPVPPPAAVPLSAGHLSASTFVFLPVLRLPLLAASRSSALPGVLQGQSQTLPPALIADTLMLRRHERDVHDTASESSDSDSDDSDQETLTALPGSVMHFSRDIDHIVAHTLCPYVSVDPAALSSAFRIGRFTAAQALLVAGLQLLTPQAYVAEQMSLLARLRYYHHGVLGAYSPFLDALTPQQLIPRRQLLSAEAAPTGVVGSRLCAASARALANASFGVHLNVSRTASSAAAAAAAGLSSSSIRRRRGHSGKDSNIAATIGADDEAEGDAWFAVHILGRERRATLRQFGLRGDGVPVVAALTAAATGETPRSVFDEEFSSGDEDCSANKGTFASATGFSTIPFALPSSHSNSNKPPIPSVPTGGLAMAVPASSAAALTASPASPLLTVPFALFLSQASAGLISTSESDTVGRAGRRRATNNSSSWTRDAGLLTQLPAHVRDQWSQLILPNRDRIVLAATS